MPRYNPAHQDHPLSEYLGGYVSKRVGQLMDELGSRSVLVIVANLKETIHGSSDVLNAEQMDKAGEVIKFYLDHWVDNYCKSSPRAILMARYDKSVKRLLYDTLRIYEEYRRTQ